MKRLTHVEKHLRPQVRSFVRPLLEIKTINEIARDTNYSRSMVEQAWKEIRITMALPASSGMQPIARLALLRLVMGLDPCVCERLMADLEKTA